MKKNRKRSSLKIILKSLPLLFFFFFLVGFLVYSNWQIDKKRDDLKTQIKTLEQEIMAREEKNKALKAGISRAGEADYAEEVARERLSLKKPGEETVVIVPPPKESPKPGEEPQKNFFEKVLEKLGIKF